jgi:hypothetical protein
VTTPTELQRERLILNMISIMRKLGRARSLMTANERLWVAEICRDVGDEIDRGKALPLPRPQQQVLHELPEVRLMKRIKFV